MTTPNESRPDYVADVCLQDAYDYLDDLRDSGVTNMFGAGPYLQQEYGLDKHFARKILSMWMQDFCCNEGDRKGG